MHQHYSHFDCPQVDLHFRQHNKILADLLRNRCQYRLSNPLNYQLYNLRNILQSSLYNIQPSSLSFLLQCNPFINRQDNLFLHQLLYRRNNLCDTPPSDPLCSHSADHLEFHRINQSRYQLVNLSNNPQGLHHSNRLSTLLRNLLLDHPVHHHASLLGYLVLNPVSNLSLILAGNPFEHRLNIHQFSLLLFRN